ncbi:unnamed protein product [Effrenium voratum]|nr:unnamed protein product [Effrenium voratum]
MDLWILCLVASLTSCLGAEPRPAALWASLKWNKSGEDVGPVYASMGGDDPASGKDWKSKPHQQVSAWNKSMHHTYHSYIPEKYQALPSKATEIRTKSAGNGHEKNFTEYTKSYGGLAKVAMQGAKRDAKRQSTPKDKDSDGADYEQYLPPSGKNGQQGGSFIPDYKQFTEHANSGSAKRDAGQRTADAEPEKKRSIPTHSDGADYKKYLPSFGEGKQQGASFIPNYKQFSDTDNSGSAKRDAGQLTADAEPEKKQSIPAHSDGADYDKFLQSFGEGKQQGGSFIPHYKQLSDTPNSESSSQSFFPFASGKQLPVPSMPWQLVESPPRAPKPGFLASNSVPLADMVPQEWRLPTLLASVALTATVACGVYAFDKYRRTVRPPESLLG